MGFTVLKIEWNPWLGDYCLQIPILSALCPELNLLNRPRKTFVGMPLHYMVLHMFLFLWELTWSETRMRLKVTKVKTLDVPEVRVLRSGRLLSDVTLLLSALRSTDGSGSVGVSECERSCSALPPAPGWSLVVTPGITALLHTRRCELGEGEGEREGWWWGKWASPGMGSGGWGGCLGWWGRVLFVSLRASILRTACGDAAPVNTLQHQKAALHSAALHQ
jgi:hypothetical protein